MKKLPSLSILHNSAVAPKNQELKVAARLHRVSEAMRKAFEKDLNALWGDMGGLQGGMNRLYSDMPRIIRHK